MKILIYILVLSLCACASQQKTEIKPGRLVIDNSKHGSELPAWVYDTAISEEEGDKILFKSQFTIMGSERVNSCYDLAKLEMNEKVLSEIDNEFRGEVLMASQGITDGGPLLTKSLISKLSGNIRGLRYKDQAYERYVTSGIERIDCFVRAQMSKRDYIALKTSVLDQLVASNNEVAIAMRKRQALFLNPTVNKDEQGPRGSELPKEVPVKGFEQNKEKENSSKSSDVSLKAEQQVKGENL